MARKQKELEGMETATAIPEVDAAAERLKAASKKRKHAQDTEKEAKAILLQLMRDNKLKVYEDHDTNPPLIVMLTTSEDVKVEELREGGPDAVDEETGEAPDGAALEKLKGRASKKSAPEA